MNLEEQIEKAYYAGVKFASDKNESFNPEIYISDMKEVRQSFIDYINGNSKSDKNKAVLG